MRNFSHKFKFYLLFIENGGFFLENNIITIVGGVKNNGFEVKEKRKCTGEAE